MNAGVDYYGATPPGRNPEPILVEALKQIAERRLLIMDDLGETEADAMVKVAEQALQETGNA